MRRQAGFTLVELVMVIVIIGILSAVAIPKFVDLRSNSAQASVDGLAGAASSASGINQAGCQVTAHVVTASKCVAVSTCAGAYDLLNAAPALVAAGTPVTSSYNLSTASAAISNTVNDTTSTCTLQYGTTGGGSVTATYTMIAAGN